MIFVALVIIVGIIVGGVAVKHQVDAWYVHEIKELDSEHQEVVDEFEEARAEYKRLKAKSKKLEDQLVLGRYGHESRQEDGAESMASPVPGKKHKQEVQDPTAQWLLKNQKITLEQYAQAKEKSDSSAMTFLAACQSLGYVSSDLAGEIKKSL